jgi:pyruvate/2-oxoacid:ferredoxin oxidoreductase beta subunit/Pyruvate/2-oxoacid:ferredoxin oxidoreductase gamma subunit
MTTPILIPDAALPYCKGCGHGLVLHAVAEALESLALPPADIAVVTDIGCVGLADALMAAPHTVHTTHGRSTVFATGMALADSVLGAGRLKPIVLIGDGGAMIGINHLVNAALLNADVTVIVHNNFLFGMTGGQNSAFSPEAFITATTRTGNTVPPLDLARVLLGSRAGFVARKIATDRDLAGVIARAVSHPGFAAVEVLELCTGFATRWNRLTGSQLKRVAEAAGYELGVLRAEVRPRFAPSAPARSEPREAAHDERPEAVRFEAGPGAPWRLVLAGTAGERVQTAATLLAHAAMRCGLEATQKNDNPVTQGTGFSVAEIILSPNAILFTGIVEPDAVLVVSADGALELERSGVLSQVTAETLVLADAGVALPELPCSVRRFPFRTAAGAKNAALAAIAEWLHLTGALPMDALWLALDARFGKDAHATRAAVERTAAPA